MERKNSRWELIGCFLSGHEFVGYDAATVTADDASFVRLHDGHRFHRCLRCDGWFHQPAPVTPTREHVPGRDEITLPVRGKALRDRYVLRLIAVDRAVHVVLLVGIAVILLLFVSHRNSLESTYDGLMNSLLGSSGGPKSVRGWLGHLRRFFIFSPQHLDELAFVALAYAALEAAEMVGLWFAKRWAEYLTFIATCAFLPLEVYELTSKLSPLKLVVLALNLAVAVYLLVAKRLFGVRGGGKAIDAHREATSGWEAFDRATPPATPAGDFV